jgi:hypothetical protein
VKNLQQQDVFPGFFKREARPSDNEVLTMRLVDRGVRFSQMITMLKFDDSINVL